MEGRQSWRGIDISELMQLVALHNPIKRYIVDITVARIKKITIQTIAAPLKIILIVAVPITAY